MKKINLGLILSLCLLVVTGSVYATWTYYNGKVDSLEDKTSKVTIAEAVVETSQKGAFTLNKNDVVINFDANSVSDYTPVASANGNLVFNYTATNTQGSTPLGNLEATISLSSKSIFTIKQAATDKIACTLAGSTVTIPASTILSHLEFDDAPLTSKELYDAFATLVQSTVITITLAEK